MRKIAQFAIALGLASCLGIHAKADQTTPQTLSVTLRPTDYATNLVFNKFDVSLGTLTEVEFTLTGHISGSAAFENTAHAGATVNMQLRADISLARPVGSQIDLASVVASTTDQTGAFDGTIDFAGTSGKTYSNLSADQTKSVTLSSNSDVSLFQGPGTISLGFSAIGQSSATGLGNLVTKFTSSASANATLIYLYTRLGNPVGQGGGQGAQVPEPSSIALTAIGGLAILLATRRRTRTS